MLHNSSRNRRAAQRFYCSKPATITYALYAEQTKLPCRVEDVSQTGARLGVENAVRVPDVFRLNLEATDHSAECIVVWRSKSEVGVIFQAASEL